MNIENFKKLRDCIANEANFFSMEIYGYDPDKTYFIFFGPVPACNTPCSLAGWAQHLENPMERSRSESQYGDAHVSAQKWLGLTPKEGRYMFQGHWSKSERLEKITREETLEYLDYVIETGKVHNWRGLAA